MTARAHPLLMGILGGAGPEALLPLARGREDWETILHDAAEHRLTPFLHRWLKRHGAGPCPLDLAERLEARAAGLAARTMVLALELAAILRAAESRGVACAPLRGLALAERLHGDLAARPMGDLDLLVRKAELPGVSALLRDLGYREMDRRPGFAREFSYTLKFFKDRHGWVIVEPHWALTYPPFVDALDMERVWSACRRGRVVDVETWLPAAEDLLFHLCLHVAHHEGETPLLWVWELHLLLSREGTGFDWSRFLQSAREARGEIAAGRALRETHALFGAPVPARVLEALAAAPPRTTEGRLVRLLADDRGVDGKESFALLFTLKGLRTKLRYALALLFPSPDFMRIEYGVTRGRRLGAAYARRVCVLSWESLKGVVRLVV